MKIFVIFSSEFFNVLYESGKLPFRSSIGLIGNISSAMSSTTAPEPNIPDILGSPVIRLCDDATPTQLLSLHTLHDITVIRVDGPIVESS